jgi:aldehyde dehydrogenase (NAD+)
MTITDISTPRLHVGGTQLTAGSGGSFEHRNPYDGSSQATVPLAGKTEVADAVRSAVAVADEWRRWRPEERRDLLLRVAELLVANKDEFAELAALDGGTPLAGGRFRVDVAAAWFRYYAGWCDKLEGDLISAFETRRELTYSVPEPYGVVGIIITWNGPMTSLGMKVAPALAAGNCVVIKPSELTPFAPDRFAYLLAEAGLPAGVCSVLTGGADAGMALVRHPDVEKISFTGGIASARRILKDCAEEIKPVVMELGGKSANIVFPDVDDVDGIGERAVHGSIGVLSGQGCAIPSRLIVHEDIYDAVVERVVDTVRAMTVGNPLDAGVSVGPLINRAAVERVVGMIDHERAHGVGRIAIGGGRPGGELADKNFVEPTVIVGADPEDEIFQNEVFGPVLSITRFTTDDEAVALANSTRYGLASYIQSRDVERVFAIAGRLKAGGVYINGAGVVQPHSPFGGLGLSGYGKEGGRGGIDEYLRYKTVSLGQTPVAGAPRRAIP